MTKVVDNVNQDNVNHPQHYEKNAVTVTLTFEPYQLCALMDWYLGSAIKYLIRYQDKGKPVEDLQKAKWYLNKSMENSPFLTFSEFQDCKMIDAFRRSNKFIYTLFEENQKCLMLVGNSTINSCIVQVEAEIKELEK